MTVKWLKKVLDKMGNDDAPIFISVSGTLFKLCGKADKLMLVYVTKDEPTVHKGETGLCLYLCECSSEEEDKIKGDNLFLN
jgi:hypothetical protein